MKKILETKKDYEKLQQSSKPGEKVRGRPDMVKCVIGGKHWEFKRLTPLGVCWFCFLLGGSRCKNPLDVTGFIDLQSVILFTYFSAVPCHSRGIDSLQLCLWGLPLPRSPVCGQQLLGRLLHLHRIVSLWPGLLIFPGCCAEWTH